MEIIDLLIEINSPKTRLIKILGMLEVSQAEKKTITRLSKLIFSLEHFQDVEIRKYRKFPEVSSRGRF